ncbi:sugar ABC transporter ATP-binding protein [Tropheryma whipplei]|uniref:sugar ABC transporter ATP-binding protein n=1 Tax=Tropheryma whipplei TaxID=2039 RepID=UPI0004B198AC|nr:sugar ABC transporter ATP-binding protein [Tropheryma whipplei]
MRESEGVMLQMTGITKSFSGVKVLEDISFSLRKGEVHAICGENGAGKSILMKILSGVIPDGSYDGEIILENKKRRFKNLAASQAAGVVMIHQELTLIPEMSIAENIFLGNEQRYSGPFSGQIDFTKTRTKAVELMKLVHLTESPDTLIKDLGVGKQQLVEICKALGKNAKILVFDEPTAVLNESDSEHLLNLMKKFKTQGLSSIMISHKLNEVKNVADTVTVLRDGKKIDTIPADATTEDDIIRKMAGRSLSTRFPELSPSIGKGAWQIKDWTVIHPIRREIYVSNNISLTVHDGEIVGLAGLVGAGRTELARSIFGRQFGIYTSGKICRNNKELKINKVSQAIGNHIAYVTEDRKSFGFNQFDDVKNTIASASLKQFLGKHHFLDDGKLHTVAEDYRKKLKIKTASVAAPITSLSGGNQQKVILAKWICTGPDFLILDEPTRGIDVAAKYEIYSIIGELAASGKSILFISSELPELLGMTNRIYTLFEGKVTGEFKTSEASQELLMRYMTSYGNNEN